MAVDRQKIETALSQLRLLLGDKKSTEDDYQKWFENNLIVFEILGYTRTISHPNLPHGENDHYIPDFMVQKTNNLWEIFELKKPDTSILKNKDRRITFQSTFEDYCAQCDEYAKFFHEKQNRDFFNQKYSTTIQSDVPSIIVAGRNREIDRTKIHEIFFGEEIKSNI